MQPSLEKEAIPVMRGTANGLCTLVSTLGHGLTVVEIGSFAGESAEVFLRSGKVDKIYCVDPWSTGYDDKDQASFLADQAESSFDLMASQYPGKVEKVRMKSGDAIGTVFKDMLGTIDVVYIDGDHRYESVRDDILQYSKLLKVGGTLCGHDYSHEGFLAGVGKAVDELLSIDRVFTDTSWIVYDWGARTSEGACKLHDHLDLNVVVISHNQAGSIRAMKSYLDRCFPGCPVVMVLDRCIDNSQEEATACRMPHVVNSEGSGFLAGRMRDLGLQYTGYWKDTLFLDGDRIPTDCLNYESAKAALGLYDMTLIPVSEGEFRRWFSNDQFVDNPQYGKWGNDVFTCGMVMRGCALTAITTHQEGKLFVTDFDGYYGEEDRFLGDVAYHLGLTCGGAPRSMALSGGFRPARERVGYNKNVFIRGKLRAGLTVSPDDKSNGNDGFRASIRERIKSR